MYRPAQNQRRYTLRHSRLYYFYVMYDIYNDFQQAWRWNTYMCYITMNPVLWFIKHTDTAENMPRHFREELRESGSWETFILFRSPRKTHNGGVRVTGKVSVSVMCDGPYTCTGRGVWTGKNVVQNTQYKSGRGCYGSTISDISISTNMAIPRDPVYACCSY